MPDYRAEIQKGLRAALVADGGVGALVSERIYDEPPHLSDGLVYPFIRFGNVVPTTNDTTGFNGMNFRVSLEAHSRPTAGRIECSRILDAIYDALHQNEPALTMAGFRVVELIYETDTGPVRRDVDGETYVGVALYAVTVQPS